MIRCTCAACCKKVSLQYEGCFCFLIVIIIHIVLYLKNKRNMSSPRGPVHYVINNKKKIMIFSKKKDKYYMNTVTLKHSTPNHPQYNYTLTCTHTPPPPTHTHTCVCVWSKYVCICKIIDKLYRSLAALSGSYYDH